MCPTYSFRNLETNEEYEAFLHISELNTYLTENPHIQQFIGRAPALHSGRGMQKPDSGFRELLTEMKGKHSKGITSSSINNF